MNDGDFCADIKVKKLEIPKKIVEIVGGGYYAFALSGREGKGREGKGREGKGREGKGREGKGREGKGREGKGREGKGRDF
jgi:hypothetical protein